MTPWSRGLARSRDKLNHYISTTTMPMVTLPMANLAGWWLALRGSYTWCYSTLRSSGLTISCDKLKLLYIHYHDAYGHKVWQGCDLPWGGPTHEAIGLVINWKYIFATTMSMATWQGGYIQWVAPFHKVTRSIDHVVLQGHVPN